MSQLWSIIVSISTYRAYGALTNSVSEHNNPPSDYENNGVTMYNTQKGRR